MNERVSSEGEILQEPSPAELRELAEKVGAKKPEAVAISLLFSFANPKNENAVAGALGRLEAPLSVSHQILPEFREYERTSTVVVNAYLQPVMEQYLGESRAAVGKGSGVRDAVERRDYRAEFGCAGAGADGAFGAGGRGGGSGGDGAAERVRTDHLVRHGRNFHRCGAGGRRGAEQRAIGNRRVSGGRAHARYSHRGSRRRLDCALRRGGGAAGGAGVGGS